jgi:hypothetical protein
MTAAGARSPSSEEELATLLVEAEQARAPQLRGLVVARLTRAQKAAELEDDPPPF